jgi:hypothetical protein
VFARVKPLPAVSFLDLLDFPIPPGTPDLPAIPIALN